MLVNVILTKKQNDVNSNFSHDHDEIDILVYKLYNLISEEIKLMLI